MGMILTGEKIRVMYNNKRPDLLSKGGSPLGAGLNPPCKHRDILNEFGWLLPMKGMSRTFIDDQG
jgi:hypothetical protein